jgi:hypothetical protein
MRLLSLVTAKAHSTCFGLVRGIGADKDSCVVFDPLDGSSNIDAGVNVGTIFGIYKVVSIGLFPVCHED